MKFLTLLLLAISFSANSRPPVSGNRYELLSGIRKDRRVQKFSEHNSNSKKYMFGKAPASFLAKNYDFIPYGSKVLDVGMGEGRNSVFLATKGYKVTGVDISSSAVRKARMLAREFDVRIEAVLSPMEEYEIPKGSLDAIICFYYVDKKLHEKFFEWLRPGGILVYEAYTIEQLKVQSYESYNESILLKPGELLTMFPKYRILKYEEPRHKKGFTSSVILQRPKE